jgi:hypothetical protein
MPPVKPILKGIVTDFGLASYEKGNEEQGIKATRQQGIKAEGRRQKAEGRRQKAEGRRQKTLAAQDRLLARTIARY